MHSILNFAFFLQLVRELNVPSSLSGVPLSEDFSLKIVLLPGKDQSRLGNSLYFVIKIDILLPLNMEIIMELQSGPFKLQFFSSQRSSNTHRDPPPP